MEEFNAGDVWTNIKNDEDCIVLGLVLDANNVFTGFNRTEVLYTNLQGKYFCRGQDEFREKFKLKTLHNILS